MLVAVCDRLSDVFCFSNCTVEMNEYKRLNWGQCTHQ